MRVRFAPDATRSQREAVLAALASRGLAASSDDGFVRVQGLVADDALALAAMPGVVEIAPVEEPQATLREAIFTWTCGAATVLGVLVLFAANLAPTLGAPADPLRTPATLRPSWPLTPWYAAVDRAPSWVPVPLLFLVAAAVLFFWPNLARRFATEHPRLHALVGVAALALVAGLAVLEVTR
jgi:cytochrome b/b6/petD-like protein